ncbi:hypothetical protein CALCODRAFT_480192 [Calocera cornea HHB12733]|uniref:Peroxisomal membrane protein PEX14 n=1 Tax=Calocera cornea HHB12733 TaxID=1353952 RepID=A0A165IV88_9BASI|nr:hypothetical protein CALCODRAFT_480192 [Calocera cornea HHB12733]
MSSSDPPGPTASASTSLPPSPSRPETLQNAITFLQDPAVQAAPLAQRVAFLESKGMTPGEIGQALEVVGRTSLAGQGGNAGGGFGAAAAGSGSGRVVYSPPPPAGAVGMGAGMQQLVAPPLPGRDWRDYFIMAIISGGLTFAVLSLVRRFLLPHLSPPSGPAFTETSTALTAQFDSLAQQLQALEEAQERERAEREREREEVSKAVGEVRGAVESVREGEGRAREEWEEVRREVRGVKELVPKMLEKLTSAQSRTLAELQAELKSLKLLLLNRTPPNTTTTATTASNNTPGAGSAGTTASPVLGYVPGGPIPPNNHQHQPYSYSAPGTPGIPIVAPGPGFMAGSGRPSIPAWQLRPSSAEPSAGGSGALRAGAEEAKVAEAQVRPEVESSSKGAELAAGGPGEGH